LLIGSPESRTASAVLVVMIAAAIGYAYWLTKRRVLY
jgi:hypothetical protein